MQNINNMKIAAILAGGQARRMNGIDKGLVKYHSKPLIEHVLQRVQPQADELIINANRNIEQYQDYGYKVISDDFFDEYGTPMYLGPLAGMLSVMQYIREKIPSAKYVNFIPCDAPHLPLDLIDRTLSQIEKLKADVAIPFTAGRTQPVFACIQLDLIPSLFDYLEKGNNKIDTWYEQHYWIQVDFNKDAPAFANYNTLDDLEQS